MKGEGHAFGAGRRALQVFEEARLALEKVRYVIEDFYFVVERVNKGGEIPLCRRSDNAIVHLSRFFLCGHLIYLLVREGSAHLNASEPGCQTSSRFRARFNVLPAPQIDNYLEGKGIGVWMPKRCRKF